MTRNLVVISDTHFGCRLALCGRAPVPLDDGGFYSPSPIQLKLADLWDEFFEEFVPMATRGEPWDLVVNGDVVEGMHHRATTPISQNPMDQKRLALTMLRPVVSRAARYFHIRGTEAHVGSSAHMEEDVARELGAQPNEAGQHARYELWVEVGGALVHLLHHIGTTGSQAYEATAVHKELVEHYAEAARWGERPPDVIIRSHRHRYIQTRVPTARGHAICVVTPCWQGKTPFAWKIPGARLSLPQFGGIVVRWSEEGEIYVRDRVWTPQRSKVE